MNRTLFTALLGTLFWMGCAPTPEESEPSSQTAETPRAVTTQTFDGIEFVWIEPGSFMMGSRLSPAALVSNYGGKESYFDDEYPRHQVTLTQGFWMGKYEVTNAQYRRFKSSHNSKDYKGNDFNGESQPAVSVSWNDAVAFCNWLSERTGETYRLPTEAEWEYACRAGTETQRYWGDDDGTMGQYANTYDRTGKAAFSFFWDAAETTDGHKVTAPVGSFKANGWGLHDMIGNVYEWCGDWYGDYPSGPVADPSGASSGAYRVLRGGSWLIIPWSCRSANRNWGDPTVTSSLDGFRVVCLSAR